MNQTYENPEDEISDLRQSLETFEKEKVLRYLEKHIPFRKVNVRILTRTEK